MPVSSKVRRAAKRAAQTRRLRNKRRKSKLSRTKRASRKASKRRSVNVIDRQRDNYALERSAAMMMQRILSLTARRSLSKRSSRKGKGKKRRKRRKR